MKIKLGILLLCAATMGLPAQLRADGTNKPPVEKKETKGKKSTTAPFHGKLKSVDQTAKTISVGDLVLQVTSETKILKDGKPGVLADGVPGEKVAGSYKKTEDGKLDAVTLKFGTEPETDKAKKKDDSKKEM